MNFKAIIRLIPWIIVLVLLVFLWLRRLGNYTTPERTEFESTLVLQEIEKLGKLELVKYNYKEVVEMENVAKRYLDLGYFYIPGGQDQKAILIAQGEAVACIDLQKIKKEDIELRQDTLYVNLPQPEICYYKVNLENSKFYDLKTSKDQKKAGEFVDEVYAKAEAQIREAAVQSGILADAKTMSNSVLKPFLENITGVTVILNFSEQPNPIQFEVD
ncbi:hypothetical protein MATR_01890 [Marivirga tractuosa]|uniref:DUF4230 domain-containing protein n=1 Tax=Marivirga tractuosa (strain ATCC 23168 / DSM 4126 / NBRC 15989 / NCIMB 1408 / VKM B-1430 / H-43) TaxID=643867 RepID=E4TVS4_MARTH|nr:DUF4230 domain-containing protein [Marivirga tractuosa]ADR22172.1 hypothetical protein Ftrac_2190 [Marivirga tractuosa DSM 4126]BDD13364.1 hypothetical protein MATR_01890 [Marivirga tractuosa]